MSTIPPEEPTQPSPAAPSAPAMPSYGAPEQQQLQPEYYAAPQGYLEQPPVATTVKDTNTYALVAVILAFIVPLAGIIFGHMGLSQIKRTGDAGRGLALTALIYGYCVFVLGAVFLFVYIGFIFVMIGSFANGSYSSF